MAGSARRRWPVLIALGVALAACAAPGATTAAGPTTAGITSTDSSGVDAPAAAPNTSLVQTPAGTVADTTVPALASCVGDELETVLPGALTIGTGPAASAPWYLDDDPANGRGLEAAVGYAIADGLGFTADQVRWARIDRAQAAAGAADGFDLDLDRFTAPDPGTTTADYSTGYYSVTDSVLVPAGAPKPASAAAVRKLTLGLAPGAGAQVDGESTGVPPRQFATDRAAIDAVTSRAVQGVVLPTPAAVAVARQNAAVVVAGQLPTDPAAQPDQLKALLPRGSGLTGCVSAVIDRLRVEGTLDSLAATWVDPVAPPLS